MYEVSSNTATVAELSKYLIRKEHCLQAVHVQRTDVSPSFSVHTVKHAAQ